MRLLIDAVGNSSGGGLEVLKQLARALVEAAPPGAQLVVCVSSVQAQEALEALDLELKCRRCALAQPLIGRIAWMLGGVELMINTHKPDLVLSLNGMGLMHSRQVILVQQPLLFDMQGLASMPWGFAARMATIRAITAASCARAQLVIAQTPQVREAILDAFGLEPAIVEVFWPAALEPEVAIRELSSAPGLLYVGHHAPYKNTAILPAIMQRLWQTMPEATLTITGEPPWLKAQPLDPRVIVHHHLEHDQVVALMQRSQFLLMPSISETVGLPLLEAMGAGALIIAADRPYARAVCGDEGAASFVAADDVDAWVEQICALWLEPKRQRALAQSRARILSAQGPLALAHRLWGMISQEPKPCT